MKRVLSLIISVMLLITAIGYPVAYAQEPDTAAGNPEVPQIRIVTVNGNGTSLKKTDGYIGATVTIVNTDGSQIGGEGEIKVRGNSTSGVNKKSYTFKLSKKLDILGMGKAKKWALIANAFDPTLWRNYVGINTSAEVGVPYSSEQAVVEVWLDNSFRGCYNLVEPIQEGKTRVDIDIESNNGMNDFMIEREYNRAEADAVYFSTNGIRFVCDEPEAPNEEQLDYIQSTMDNIVSVLKTGTRAEIEEAIDLSSFARYAILNEFVKAVDFDYSSVFFYYKNGKLYAGPGWDYDLSQGNVDPAASANYAASADTEGVHCAGKHLYKWLYQREWFFDVIRTVYLEHQAYFDNIGADGGLIDTLYQTYSGPVDRNFSPNGSNWRLTSYFKNLNRQPESTYQANLDFYKNWCSSRAAWLDGYFTEDIAAYTLGDSDADGLVSIIDATFIQRKLSGIGVPSFDSTAADADGSGTVAIPDVTVIQRYLAGMKAPAQIGTQLQKKI